LVTSLLFNKNEEDLDEIIGRLRIRRKSTHQSLLAFLAILFEQYGYSTEKLREELDEQVVAMELRTGMASLNTSRRNFSRDVPKYEALMRDLHACNTNLIFLGAVLNFEVEFGNFCNHLFNIFEDLRRQAGYGAFHAAKARDEFRQNLGYCLDSSRSRRNQTDALQIRIKSQINLVRVLTSP
jgi:hypothetical protein